MRTCVVDFNVNDTAPSVLALLSRLQPALDAVPDAVGEWTIDCSRSRYLGPDAAAVLYALHLMGKARGRSPAIVLPVDPPKLAAFCAFSGLRHHLHGGPPPDPEHPECETVPLEQFVKPRANQADPIVRLVRRHLGLSIDTEEYLRTCVSELSQNVADHARSPIGGVWSARFLSQSREVRVAVVDLGVGIASTLGSRYADLADASVALERVLKGNYSSKSLERNMGLGISNLALIVVLLNGRLTLISGDAAAIVRSHKGKPRTEIRRAGFRFPGTAAFFTLPAN